MTLSNFRSLPWQDILTDQGSYEFKLAYTIKKLVRNSQALRLILWRGKMAKRHPEHIIQKVRSLRSIGWSLGEISIKIKLPKNTISGWVKDIRLTEKQKERIRQKIIDSGAIGRTLAIKVSMEKIERWKEDIRQRVEHFGKFASENPQIGKLICGILYLCEGSKYPSSKTMTFGNSDPVMIKTFLGLLRKYFNIQEEKLHCRIMPRWDQDINELQCFWSKITEIPVSRFYKTKPDRRTKGKSTLKERYKGVCALQYCDTSLQFELQAIGEAVIKGGI